MTTKLTIKHKDSLALKENKLLQEKNSYKQSNLKKCEHVPFGWLILSIFLIYWFVLCPLIWAMCDASKIYWFSRWPFHFLIIAFLIWFMIMCTLLIYWRKRLQVRHGLEVNLMTSKYGSDNVEKHLSANQIFSGDANSLEIKKQNNPDQKATNDSRNYRKKDLPPLMIHKQMSDTNIDDTAVVHVENDENDQLNVASDYVERSSLQDYLKLVTVSPSENGMKSPPMSPRELFFIDLIREADRVESAKAPEKTFFFPDEATQSDTKSEKETETINNNPDTTNEENAENTENEDEKNEKNEEITDNTSQRESSYFIADVESSVNEKTEVFLQISSCVEGQSERDVEEPVLLLQCNKENV